MRWKGTLAAVLVLALVLFSFAPVTCFAACGMSIMGACPATVQHHGAGGPSSSFSDQQHAAGMAMRDPCCAPGHKGSNGSGHAQVVARQAAQQTVPGTMHAVPGTMNAGCDRSVLCPAYLQGGTSVQTAPSFAPEITFASPASVRLAPIWSSRSGVHVRGHRPRVPVRSLAALGSVSFRV